jgi:hypothetical protein
MSDLSVRLPPVLAHGITPHLDAVGIVYELVENAIGQRGIAYLFAPFRDWQLRSEDRRTRLVAVFADLPEVAALGF